MGRNKTGTARRPKSVERTLDTIRFRDEKNRERGEEGIREESEPGDERQVERGDTRR